MTLSSGYMYRTLGDAFSEYRGDPGRRTHVRFRRERARQLRGLLSEPEAVDLHKFNHEVWVLSSGAYLRGEGLTSRCSRMPQYLARLSVRTAFVRGKHWLW